MNMEILTHEEFGEIRMQEIEGTPWFVANDICKALDISNQRQATAFLDETEAGVISTDTRSETGVTQKRDMVHVNESGLYQLIFQSRKPNAKKFTRWVTSEVLPALRKTGGYDGLLESRRAELIKERHLLVNEQNRVKYHLNMVSKQLRTINEQRPMVCPKCGYICRNSRVLGGHMAGAHGKHGFRALMRKSG